MANAGNTPATVAKPPTKTVTKKREALGIMA